MLIGRVSMADTNMFRDPESIVIDELLSAGGLQPVWLGIFTTTSALMCHASMVPKSSGSGCPRDYPAAHPRPPTSRWCRFPGPRATVVVNFWIPTGDRCTRGASRGSNLRLDRPGPRAGVLVGQERHRRHHAGSVTGLAGALKDRRDVPGERGLACCRRGRLSEGGGAGRNHQRRTEQAAEEWPPTEATA